MGVLRGVSLAVAVLSAAAILATALHLVATALELPQLFRFSIPVIALAISALLARALTRRWGWLHGPERRAMPPDKGMD